MHKQIENPIQRFADELSATQRPAFEVIATALTEWCLRTDARVTELERNSHPSQDGDDA